MADLGGAPGGPDSADPKDILRDLQQLAAVAARLGVDLQRTAAMGQQIAGQKTASSGISEAHAAHHPGGGTGYTNMAEGAIYGSTMSARMAKGSTAVSKIVSDYNKFKKPLSFGKMMFDANLAPTIIDVMRRDLEQKRSEEFKKIISDHNAKQSRGLTGAYNRWADSAFGSKMNRRFARSFLTVHGASQMYNALTGPINESSGETRATKIADVGAGLVEVSGRMYEAAMMVNIVENAARTWRIGQAVAKAGGAGAWASRAWSASRVARSAGPQVVISLAVEAGIKTVQEAMASWKFGNKLEKDMAKFRQGMLGDLGRKTEKIDGYEYPAEPKPLSASEISKMSSVLEQSRRDYYIDEDGKRQKRNIISRALRHSDETLGKAGWIVAPMLKLWNYWGSSEESTQELKWRMEQATKAHESAIKKAQVMDWNGAIKETQKAKELIVAQEAMPFFWKNPQTFLKNMESARIAGRNWARSQQPRGASRTGD